MANPFLLCAGAGGRIPAAILARVQTEIASGLADGVPWRVYIGERPLPGAHEDERLLVQRGEGSLTVSLLRLCSQQGTDGQVIGYRFLTDSTPKIFLAVVHPKSERAVVQYLTGTATELKIVVVASGNLPVALVACHLQVSPATLIVQGPGFRDAAPIGHQAKANVSRSTIGSPIIDL